MATATKRRPKKAEQAEMEAKALASMPEPHKVRRSCPDCGHEWDADDGDLSPCERCRPTVGSGQIKRDPEKLLEADSEADAAESAAPADAIDDERRKAQAFDQIAELNDAVEKAFTTWSLADKRAKDLKKAYEGAVSELRGLISATAHPAPMPLFDEQKGDSASPVAEVNPSDESWRDIPLREALPELSDSVHGKLEGAQLFTMGELANWTAENGGRRRLTDIAGIGSGTAGKIEEATMAFWSRWKPQAKGEPIVCGMRTEPNVMFDANGNQIYPKVPTDLEDAYRLVLIPWSQFADDASAPAPKSNLKTIGDVIKLAATTHQTAFDALKFAGLSSIAADDVVKWMARTRDEMGLV